MKKEIKTIDPQIELDCNEIIRIRKIVNNPSSNDINLIYHLYKKYIDNNALEPIVNCSSCSRSIGAYYWKVVSLPTNPNDLIKLIK